MINTRFTFLGFGTVVAAGLVAAYTGYLPGKPTLEKPAALVSTQPSQPAPAFQVAPAVAPTNAAPQTEAAPVTVGPPSFDVLRVDPSGTIVIAGKAASNATVDLLSGSKIIGTTKSSGIGDFVIALDNPLKPGDYQLVLRSTGANGTAMTSLETAVVSIPETKTGQVLALVEQSGQPSRMITKPAATGPSAQETGSIQAAAPKSDKPIVQPAVDARIAVEAVEIEGNKIFIAGTAVAGSTVKVFANSDLLGSVKTTPDGRFLVQTVKELAVGDYIIRADMMGKDGMTAVARAAVPFKREAGEHLSAVASADQAVPAGQTATDSAQPSTDGAVAPLKNVDGSVIIRRGDNLWRISRRTYGEGMRYTTIYLANKEQIRNPDRIFPGQVFALPEKEKKLIQ